MRLPCACSSSGCRLRKPSAASALGRAHWNRWRGPQQGASHPWGAQARQAALCLPGPFRLRRSQATEGKRHPASQKADLWLAKREGQRGSRKGAPRWLSELWHKNCTEITVGQFIGIFQRWKDVFGKPNLPGTLVGADQSASKCAKAYLRIKS